MDFYLAHWWGADAAEEARTLQEADISEALLEALKLMQPPYNFARARVEAALEAAHGNPAAALEVPVLL